MWLRETVAKLFAKPKDRPEKAWAAVNASRRDKMAASRERTLQIRDFDKKAEENFVKDVNEERQRLALQHPGPVLTPDGMKEEKSAWQLQNQADKNIIARNEARREEIRQQPNHRLIAAGKARQELEAQDGPKPPYEAEKIDRAAADKADEAAKDEAKAERPADGAEHAPQDEKLEPAAPETENAPEDEPPNPPAPPENEEASLALEQTGEQTGAPSHAPEAPTLSAEDQELAELYAMRQHMAARESERGDSGRER